MKHYLLLSLLMFYFFTLIAQEFGCGNGFIPLTITEKVTALSFSKNMNPLFDKNSSIDSIPLTIHLIQTDMKVDTAFIRAIEEEIKKMNQVFAAMNLQFYTCGSARIIHVLGNYKYEYQEADLLNVTHHVPNTINIYFAEDVIIDNESYCGYAYFPFELEIEERYIMMNNDCATNGATLMHEMGHFYGLFHTHETYFGEELVDRTNCEETGDLLCDTPADPNLSWVNNLMQGCTYIGSLVDANGDVYRPNPNNLMSYARSRCRSTFSREQLQKATNIHETLNDYLYVNCTDFPDLAISTNSSEININSTMNINIEYTFDASLLKQKEEATFRITLLDDKENTIETILYEELLLLEPEQKNFVRQYNLDLPNTKLTGNYYLQANLDPEYKVVEKSKVNNQIITPLKINNSKLGNLLLQPNPVKDEVNVFLRTEEGLTGNLGVNVFSYDGRLQQQFKAYKKTTEYLHTLDVSDLQAGFYFVYISLEDLRQDFVFKFVKL